MKTVCVAVIVLSFISVCQPASLECKKLLKPVDQDQNVLGRWYLIGVSSTYCLAQTIFVSLLVPSVTMDITSTERQNFYNVLVTGKSYGFCENVTAQMFYTGNSLFGLDDKPKFQMKDNAMLLHSGCQDCLVMSEKNATGIIVLFSRRPVITADEMEEFEAQANCIGLHKPQIFDSDHDQTNCRSSESETTDLSPLITQRMTNMFKQIAICTTNSVLYYPQTAYRWVQNTWNSFW